MNHGILKVIQDYDNIREAYISSLEKENESLRAKVEELINQAVANAEANSAALLKGIMSGVISKPKENT